MWQRHIMHSMDLVQPELAGIESIQCRAGLVSELVLSGEMSSKISKLKSYVEQHSFPLLPCGASCHELPSHDLQTKMFKGCLQEIFCEDIRLLFFGVDLLDSDSSGRVGWCLDVCVQK